MANYSVKDNLVKSGDNVPRCHMFKVPCCVWNMVNTRQYLEVDKWHDRGQCYHNNHEIIVILSLTANLRIPANNYKRFYLAVCNKHRRVFIINLTNNRVLIINIINNRIGDIIAVLSLI